MVGVDGSSPLLRIQKSLWETTGFFISIQRDVTAEPRDINTLPVLTTSIRP